MWIFLIFMTSNFVIKFWGGQVYTLCWFVMKIIQIIDSKSKQETWHLKADNNLRNNV